MHCTYGLRYSQNVQQLWIEWPYLHSIIEMQTTKEILKEKMSWYLICTFLLFFSFSSLFLLFQFNYLSSLLCAIYLLPTKNIWNGWIGEWIIHNDFLLGGIIWYDVIWCDSLHNWLCIWQTDRMKGWLNWWGRWGREGIKSIERSKVKESQKRQKKRRERKRERD